MIGVLNSWNHGGLFMRILLRDTLIIGMNLARGPVINYIDDILDFIDPAAEKRCG